MPVDLPKMEPDDLELLADAAATLSDSIASLESLIDHLVDKIGGSRVEVLRGLRENAYEREETAEIRALLTYSERKLLWAWVRVQGLKDIRRDIGRDSMRRAR